MGSGARMKPLGAVSTLDSAGSGMSHCSPKDNGILPACSVKYSTRMFP